MSKHAVSTLIFRNENDGLERMEILLVCENASGEKDAWRWQLPGGKCCQSEESACCFETAEKTVERECAEEAGYQVKPRELVSRKEMISNESGKRFLKYFYRGEIVGGQAAEKNVFGIVSPRWFPVAKLPRNMFRSHADAIRNYVVRMLAQRKSTSIFK